MSIGPLNYPTLIQQIADAYGVGEICSVVTSDPRFAVWSASSHPNLHHYARGGLAQHTHEVLTLCLTNALKLNALSGKAATYEKDLRALVCGAVFHDYAKIWDYQPLKRIDHLLVPPDPYQDWEPTNHKTHIHHIARSAIEWTKAVDRFPAYRDIEDDVLHAILSHHGQKQWGSPVEPRTRIAWLLHLSDQLSARMNDADTLHLPFDKAKS